MTLMVLSLLGSLTFVGLAVAYNYRRARVERREREARGDTGPVSRRSLSSRFGVLVLALLFLAIAVLVQIPLK